MTIERTEDGTRFQDKAHLVVSATGVLNLWKMPNIPGINDFKGILSVSFLTCLQTVSDMLLLTAYILQIGTSVKSILRGLTAELL